MTIHVLPLRVHFLEYKLLVLAIVLVDYQPKDDADIYHGRTLYDTLHSYCQVPFSQQFTLNNQYTAEVQKKAGVNVKKL